MKSKRRRRLLVSLVITLIVTYAAATEYVTRRMASRLVQGPNTYRALRDIRESAPPPDISRNFRIEVDGPQKASLSVWVMDPSQPARGTVFVLHGFGNRKDSMLGVGRQLRAEGFRAVLVDQPAHGASTGGTLTFGVRESDDLKQLLDAMIARSEVIGPVAVFGFSYGGSTAIQWAAKDSRIQGVVTLSTFSSMREVVPYFAHRSLPRWVDWLFGWRIDAAMERAAAQTGFQLDAASPASALKTLKYPVLIMHGTRDTWIPFQHAERLKAAAPPGSRLVPIPDGDHFRLMSDKGDRVALRQLIDWMKALPTP